MTSSIPHASSAPSSQLFRFAIRYTNTANPPPISTQTFCHFQILERLPFQGPDIFGQYTLDLRSLSDIREMLETHTQRLVAAAYQDWQPCHLPVEFLYFSQLTNFFQWLDWLHHHQEILTVRAITITTLNPNLAAISKLEHHHDDWTNSAIFNALLRTELSVGNTSWQ